MGSVYECTLLLIIVIVLVSFVYVCFVWLPLFFVSYLLVKFNVYLLYIAVMTVDGRQDSTRKSSLLTRTGSTIVRSSVQRYYKSVSANLRDTINSSNVSTVSFNSVLPPTNEHSCNPYRS